MYYIWCDESDKEGEYYSNFFGGILIESKNLKRVMDKMEKTIKELDITEEIKWQKVNQHFYEKYIKLVDFIFELLEENLIKIRIFFRHNQYVPKYLTREQMRKEYSLLYYQFIKHAFGFRYSNNSNLPVSLHIALDELPINESEKKEFKEFLYRLRKEPEYLAANIQIKKEDILEVDSKKNLPLQLLDLILGAICFRLNDKHKIKMEGSKRRGKRTIVKEKLYKHINFRIRQIRPGFNIGMSTGYSSPIEIWTMPYRHWSFIPKMVEVDHHKTKKEKK